MTVPERQSIPINQAEKEDDIDRVNEFFNSNEIKQALHRFTYSATLERAVERDDRRLLYIEDGERIIGALMVWGESTVLDPDEAQIRLVAVASEFRNQGLGENLCLEAEKFATESGKQRISADVSRRSPAVEFWESIGYEPSSQWETGNGREMVLMEKHL